VYHVRDYHKMPVKPLFYHVLIVINTKLISSFLFLDNHLCADDTQLFFSFHLLNFDSSISYLQNAVQQISSWMTVNLTINSSKTELFLIGRKNQLAKIRNSSTPTLCFPCIFMSYSVCTFTFRSFSLLVPRARLSWPSRQLFSVRKYTVSYTSEKRQGAVLACKTPK